MKGQTKIRTKLGVMLYLVFTMLITYSDRVNTIKYKVATVWSKPSWIGNLIFKVSIHNWTSALQALHNARQHAYNARKAIKCLTNYVINLSETTKNWQFVSNYGLKRKGTPTVLCKTHTHYGRSNNGSVYIIRPRSEKTCLGGFIYARESHQPTR